MSNLLIFGTVSVNSRNYFGFGIYRPHLKDHGTCDVSASDVSLDVSVKVGVDTKGHGTLSTDGCSFNVGHLSVKFHGGARFVTHTEEFFENL